MGAFRVVDEEEEERKVEEFGLVCVHSSGAAYILVLCLWRTEERGWSRATCFFILFFSSLRETFVSHLVAFVSALLFLVHHHLRTLVSFYVEQKT